MLYVDELLTGLSNPAVLFGHLTYFLLIVSMLMRRMVWLRAFAVASGVTKVIYRAFFVFDPVSVLWETIFVLVNVGQLLLIWYYERHHRFTGAEQHFAENMPPGMDRATIRRLLRFARSRDVADGEVLTREDERVDHLLYVAAGEVRILHGDRIVATCHPGDYIGEMSFLTDNPASATARAVGPVGLLAFERGKLRAAIDGDTALRRTLEAALSRNLAEKLVRANDAARPAPVLPTA